MPPSNLHQLLLGVNGNPGILVNPSIIRNTYHGENQPRGKGIEDILEGGLSNLSSLGGGSKIFSDEQMGDTRLDKFMNLYERDFPLGGGSSTPNDRDLGEVEIYKLMNLYQEIINLRNLGTGNGNALGGGSTTT